MLLEDADFNEGSVMGMVGNGCFRILKSWPSSVMNRRAMAIYGFYGSCLYRMFGLWPLPDDQLFSEHGQLSLVYSCKALPPSFDNYDRWTGHANAWVQNRMIVRLTIREQNRYSHP